MPRAIPNAGLEFELVVGFNTDPLPRPPPAVVFRGVLREEVLFLEEVLLGTDFTSIVALAAVVEEEVELPIEVDEEVSTLERRRGVGVAIGLR